MKKILVLLLCLNIVLAPTYAFANTSLGGWTITQQIAQGASLALSATKTSIINGANVLKTSTAKITPNASQVAKVLRGGAAGYALSIAVEQLLGAVDWVLDPANNQIVYRVKEPPLEDPTLKYLYSGAYNVTYTPKLATADEVCLYLTSDPIFKEQNTPFIGSYSVSQHYIDPNGVPYYTCFFSMKNGDSYSVSLTTTINPIYDPNAEQDNEPKTLPLDVVASQVISNAESATNNDHKVGAQVATTTAAQDMLANDAATQADVETQLNANAKTQTSEEAAAEATPKDPASPDAGTNLKITFPVFCGWAPLVCEAAQSAIKFPTTVESWWNTATQAISSSWLSFKEWLDWTKNDSELPDNQTNEVTELPIPELQENAISWSASCPPDVQVPINLYGQSSTLTFSWSPWCQLLNIIKPAIIASAYIGAAFIVLGLRT